MQQDMAAIIACIEQLFDMFPPGQVAKVDQLRGNIQDLKQKYRAGVAAWTPPPPLPPEGA